MITLIIAIVLLTASLSLLLAAFISNQIDPTYSSALAIPIANLVSLALALVALPFSVIAHRRNKNTNAAKRIMLVAIGLTVVLAVLFPLANLGYLSRVQ